MANSWDENPPIPIDDYATEWESVIDDARDDPVTGIPALLDILTRMLTDYGAISPGDPDPDGVAPEFGTALRYADEIRQRFEAGEDVPAADARAAIDDLIEVYGETRRASDRMLDGSGAVEPLAEEQLDLEDDAGSTGETDPDV